MTILVVMVVLFVALAAPLAVIVYQQRSDAHVLLEVSCDILRSEIRTHEDHDDIRSSLGLPPGPPPPSLPPECS